MEKKTKQTNKNKNTHTFPKKILNEIWLKVGVHEFTYIFKIKFEKKKYSV